MLILLRKIFLIDLLFSLFRSERSPHLRFAGFLNVFSFFWLILFALIAFNFFKTVSEHPPGINYGVNIFWLLASIAFFFLYRNTSKVLKSYGRENVFEFNYLKYINPVIPVIYVSTAGILCFIILNMIALSLLAGGFFLFVLGIIFSFGLALTSDNYTLHHFIGLPQSFFKLEGTIIKEYLNPIVLLIFFVLIYFVIPLSASLFIQVRHYGIKKADRA
jgi:hypothetical protein